MLEGAGTGIGTGTTGVEETLTEVATDGVAEEIGVVCDETIGET